MSTSSNPAAAHDLAAAPAKYWSSARAGVSVAALAEAWSAAAASVWTDEFYVEPRGGAVLASYLFNSGHARLTACECLLLVSADASPCADFLTVVVDASFELNLGWAIHTRTLEAVWGEGWANPRFGAEALRSWETHCRMREHPGAAPA